MFHVPCSSSLFASRPPFACWALVPNKQLQRHLHKLGCSPKMHTSIAHGYLCTSAASAFNSRCAGWPLEVRWKLTAELTRMWAYTFQLLHQSGNQTGPGQHLRCGRWCAARTGQQVRCHGRSRSRPPCKTCCQVDLGNPKIRQYENRRIWTRMNELIEPYGLT